jgi:hypothetical protein
VIVSSRKRRAFTAIEALAATTLASLMLVSILGVLGALSRGQKTLITIADSPTWHRHLAHQLQWDLTNSQTMIVSVNYLRLDGFAGRAFATGQPTNRPTRVEYFVDADSSSGVLIRRETHVDELVNTNWNSEIVCVGVDKFTVGGDVATSELTSVEQTTEPQPIPSQLSIGVSMHNESGFEFVREFALR